MGPGFESPEVHQSAVPTPATRGSSEGDPKFIPDGKVSRSSEHGGNADTKGREKFIPDGIVGIESKQMGIIPSESVFLTQWVHPFPFRTRKLSAAVVKILGWRRPGKIAQR